MGEERTDLQRHLPFGPREVDLNSLAVSHLDEVVAAPSSESSVAQPSPNPLLQPASMTETVEPGREQFNQHFAPGEPGRRQGFDQIKKRAYGRESVTQRMIKAPFDR